MGLGGGPVEDKWTLEIHENMSLRSPLWVKDKISLNSGPAMAKDGLGGVTIAVQA